MKGTNTINHENTGDKCEEFPVKGTSVVRRWEGCPFSEQEGAQKSSHLEASYVREHLQSRTLPNDSHGLLQPRKSSRKDILMNRQEFGIRQNVLLVEFEGK